MERARIKGRNAELLKELHARQRALIAELQLTERVRLTEERQTREAVHAFEVEKAKAERDRTRVDRPRRGRPRSNRCRRPGMGNTEPGW